MSQYVKTICAHNAEGQTRVAGRATPCRKCGCLIEPEPQAVNANGVISTEAIAAGYPGEPKA